MFFRGCYHLSYISQYKPQIKGVFCNSLKSKQICNYRDKYKRYGRADTMSSLKTYVCLLFCTKHNKMDPFSSSELCCYGVKQRKKPPQPVEKRQKFCRFQATPWKCRQKLQALPFSHGAHLMSLGSTKWRHIQYLPYHLYHGKKKIPMLWRPRYFL